MTTNSESKPNINVTPLIDVLLVLLIIFMLISPLKPSTFKTNIPSEQKENSLPDTPDPKTLIVTVNPDKTLNINSQKDFGTISEPGNLISKLTETFISRSENSVFRDGTNEIEKTVFIKAPRSMPYGEVTRVVDAVKQAGAHPIGLQIDKLD